MSDFLMACGVMVIGGAGAALQRGGSMEQGLAHARELGNALVAAIKTGEAMRMQESIRAAFIKDFGAHFVQPRPMGT